MKPMLEAQIVSNFLLYIDHEIQQAGQAYTNYSGQLFPVKSNYGGLYAYSTPFKQLCNDVSVSGAQVLSGVCVNGGFIPVGSGGLVAINHYNGTVYFTTPLPKTSFVSGDYAIKDFSVEMADQPEWKLLYETKYITNNMYNQTLSGLGPDTKTTPIIYVTTKGIRNEPWGFDHFSKNEIDIRCIIIADNEFQSLNASSILKNLYNRFVPMMNGIPFDTLGNMTGINYNYSDNPKNISFQPWIETVRVIDINQKGDYKNIVKNMSVVDFHITTITHDP